MDSPYDAPETGCCPKFDPQPWHGAETIWEDKLFLKDRVRSFLHIPLNYGKVMVRSMEAISAAEAHPPEPLVLSDENSLWGADLYIAVTKEVPGARMATITGTFISKVFEGHYKNAPKWLQDMKNYIASMDAKASQYYFYYTTCPKCAEVYGKNYTVVLAKVA